MERKSTGLDQIDVSILLPTRGRTEALEKSILSLVDLATQPERLQILVGFDDDDQSSVEYFKQQIAPKIESRGAKYRALLFKPMGYIRLNEYVNALAQQSTGSWLMFWNDDAVMGTSGWDRSIAQVERFRVLRMPTHNEHPYAIFPIVPREWFEVFGYLSPHQISDAWISQMAYMMGIMENIAIQVTHERHDLTGHNHDDTFKNRVMLEGNPNHPADFNHITWRSRRWHDCVKLTGYLKSINEDTTWWENVRAGTQDPWEFMLSDQQDPNQQVKQYSSKTT